MNIKPIHVIAGLVAIAAGAVAMGAAKGSTLHRRSGTDLPTATISGSQRWQRSNA